MIDINTSPHTEVICLRGGRVKNSTIVLVKGAIYTVKDIFVSSLSQRLVELVEIPYLHFSLGRFRYLDPEVKSLERLLDVPPPIMPLDLDKLMKRLR